MSFFCAAHNTERISFLLYFFSSSMSLQAPCPPPSPRLHHPSYSKKSQEEIYDQYLRDGLQNYYLQQQKLQKTTKKLKHQTSDENAAAAEKLRKQKMSEKTNSSSKVHIFWEGHKNFVKSSPNFWLQYIRSKVRGRFRKILWPSQNIWTLTRPK